MSNPIQTTEVAVYESSQPGKYIIITLSSIITLDVIPAYTDKIIRRADDVIIKIAGNETVLEYPPFVGVPTTKLVCKLYLEVHYEPYSITKDNRTTHYLDYKIHCSTGPAIIHADGSEEWYINDRRHRDNDEPAYVGANGDRAWYRDGVQFRTAGPTQHWTNGKQEWRPNGKWHREDGPAIINADGSEEWFRDGLRHRADGPAITNADGKQVWYFNNKLHRVDGPALINADKSEQWYLNGLHHRADGPAITWADGSTHYYCNGRLHREDGPASINANGEQVWFRDGKKHRECDEPAYVYGDYRAWYKNGMRHRDGGLPAVMSDDAQQYFVDDKEITGAALAELLQRPRERSIMVALPSGYTAVRTEEVEGGIKVHFAL